MKSIVLYPYPHQLDGISIQGEMLYRGLLHNGHRAIPCDREADFEKRHLYRYFKPDVAIGIGYWGDTPELIHHPQKYGVTPVPWLNADGWIANYHETLNDLPLLLVTSSWVKKVYHRDGVHSKNMEVMPIGIDTDELRPLPATDPGIAEVKSMLKIKPDKKVIMTVGGDRTSKGFQEVLRALAIVDQEFKDWVYVGKSWSLRNPYYHYREEMKLMKELGLRDKVRLMEGALSRRFMCRLLNACDVYAAPSRIEGFGMVQVEAQACGKPAIGVQTSGIIDTIEHGKTGYLAEVGEKIELESEWAEKRHGFDKRHVVEFDEPKTFAVRADVENLAGHLLNLLTDDDQRQSMGHEARKHAVEKFDYRNTSARMADLIEKRLGLSSDQQESRVIQEREAPVLQVSSRQR